MACTQIHALVQRLKKNGLGATSALVRGISVSEAERNTKTGALISNCLNSTFFNLLWGLLGYSTSLKYLNCICFTSFMAEVVRIKWNYISWWIYFALHFIDWKFASVKAFLPNFQEQEFFHAGSPFWPFLQWHFTFCSRVFEFSRWQRYLVGSVDRPENKKSEHRPYHRVSKQTLGPRTGILNFPPNSKWKWNFGHGTDQLNWLKLYRKPALCRPPFLKSLSKKWSVSVLLGQK